MNETIKKALLGAVIAIALVVAIFEGIGFVRGPQLKPVMQFGHGTPGHGMKAMMMAAQKAQRDGTSAPASGPNLGQ